MKPICFECEETLRLSPGEIVQQMLDAANWPAFQGFGVIPGIKVATFEAKTPEIVGSRIRVINTDGSSHLEEIVEWQPDRRLTLHMTEFSSPVSRLATRFEETWNFEPQSSGTKVLRSFQLHARSALTWPLLWMVSILLKKAIVRSLRQMRDEANGRSSSV
jgi:hypothetical protein